MSAVSRPNEPRRLSRTGRGAATSALLCAAGVLCGLACAASGAAAVQQPQGAAQAQVLQAPPAEPLSLVYPAQGRRLLWVPPLGGSLDVVRPFEPPPGPYAAGHRGIDLRGSPGDRTVIAPADGTVSFSGAVVDRAVLSIRVDERTVLSMEPVESGLRAGEMVRTGQTVGALQRGGHCGDSCLHLGVRVDGEYVNPMGFFADRPMLLPW